MEDDLLQIGKTLKAAREKSDYSHYDVHRATRIPIGIIQALENDDYSAFSSSTYARSYLAQYAEFLQLDAAGWLDAFEPAEFTHDDQAISFIDEVDVHRASAAPRRQSSSAAGSKLIPSLIGMIITAAVVVGGYKIFKSFDQPEQPVTGETATQTAQTENKVEPVPPAKEPTASAEDVPDPATSSIGDISVNTTPPADDQETPEPDTTPVQTNTEADTPPRAIIIEE